MADVISVNIRSIADKVAGQGVGSAFSEHSKLVSELPEDLFRITVNSKKKADIVHCHSVEPWNLFYMHFKCKMSVVHCHFLPETLEGSIKLPKLFSWIYNKYVIHFYKTADRIVVCNPSFIPKLAKYKIPEENIKYIPNYVSTSGFHRLEEEELDAVRAEMGIEKGQFTVLGVGQIMPRKGVADFLKLAEKYPEFKFIWCGGFPFGNITDSYAELKKTIENPPANVILPGIVPREDMNKYFNAADLFFLPSYDELFPMCILEAACVGKPIMVRNLELYRDILFGHMAQGENFDDFVTLIDKISSDSEYYDFLVKESETLHSIYTGENVKKLWADYYKECKNNIK